LSNQQAPPIADLLAHADWVRALAGRLVSDPGHADDVAQETWVEVIESPARDARNVKGWLASIARNAARELGRKDSRREQRERAAARLESSVPSSEELVQRANLQREIAGHVVALPEPYRTVVLLRWYEGLLPREIAERLGRPVETVNTQLTRAHERLRAKLDREHGNRSTWRALLVGLRVPRTPVAVGAGTLGGLLVATGWKIGLCALMLVALGLSLWRDASTMASDGVARSSASPREVEPAAVAAIADQSSVLDAGSERKLVVGADTRGTPVVPSGPDFAQLETHGRVVDERGVPMPGFRLVASDSSLPRREPDGILDARGRTILDSSEVERLREHPSDLDDVIRAKALPGLREAILGVDLAVESSTDAEGRYAIVVQGNPDGRVQVESADAAWVLFTDGYEKPSRGIVQIAAPAIVLAGEVVDADGTPLEAAQLSMGIFLQNLRELAIELDTRTTSMAGPQLQNGGHFRWEHVPQVAGWSFAARCPGWETRFVGLPSASDEHMRIVLQRKRPTPKLSGVVFDEQGQPAAGARVLFGDASTQADSSGRFTLASLEWREQSDLIAAKQGAIAAILPEFGRQIPQDSSDVTGLVLQLGGKPLAIEGHVVSASGEPCVGWEVDLYDGTPAGGSVSAVERLSAGRDRDSRGPLTDASGAFRLAGLATRAYRVRALSPGQRMMVLSDPVVPGSGDLVMQVPADAIRARVTGRVVNTKGEAIGGARISIDARTAENKQGWDIGLQGGSIATDDQGRFELLNVPRYHVTMNVDVGKTRVKTFVLAPDMSSENLEIAVARRSRLHVELDPADAADAFEIVDARGERLSMTVYDSSDWQHSTRVLRDDAGFPACEASEEAVACVLLRNGIELRRIPIELMPDRKNVIRP